MSIQVQVALRSRKLGVLIRDARLAARKTLPECAQLVGVTSGVIRAWEEGRKAPSLPELEVLAYSLHLPLNHFWSKEAMSDDASLTESMNLPALIGIRQRLVGALLRQQRENASLSLQALSEQSGLPVARLKSYELGDRPIPLPELEALVALLGGQIEAVFDQTGRIGQWMLQQKAVQEFLQLPPELQNFVSKPVNRPYLELAMKLSSMSTQKLRSVAEDLLDITF
ncbi:MAG TPA: helix-turn-helix domain-containing protein [Anaerolineales bacterium]|nr:helix-turn-helix domain-containing protein [Anaerolineales bacterium]